jgi:uncharacterized protein
MLTSLIFGLLVGAVLGMTGGGGGILAVPALVTGMHWTVQQATPIALIAVAGSAAVGAGEAFMKGLVRYRAAILIAGAGVPMTSVGITLAHKLSQSILLAMFGVVMLTVAVRLIRHALSSGKQELENSTWCVGRMEPQTGRLRWNFSTAVAMAFTGALTGFMTGLLGVGGGFIIVPLLRKLTNVSMQGIVATSLFVIALVGAGGIAVSFARGVTVPISFAFGFSVTTAAGMVAGRMLARRISDRHTQIGFAYVLLAVSLELIAKAMSEF